MRITEVVELDPKVEAGLDWRVRQVNNIINSVGDDRKKLAIEVINAIASTQGIRVGIQEDLRGDPAMGRVELDKYDIKEAFLAGYQEGHIEGYNSHDRRMWEKEETPEEAYEYWIKHDRG